MVERTQREVEDTVVFGIRWDGGRRPRNGRKWLAAAVAVLVAALAPAAAQAMPLCAPAPALQTAVVVPAAGHDAGARALVARLGGRAGRRVALIGGFAARVPAGALARLSASPLVRTASPNVGLSVRDDGSSDAATSMAIVRGASGAQAIQDAGGDGSGVGIAVVDSGVMRVQGLDGGQVVRGPDFSDEAYSADLRGLDTFGHGTHLAGVIAGRDGDVTGVAPGATVVSVKVADSDGQTSLLRVLLGLDWVRRHADDPGLNIRIVNLSLGVDASSAGYVRDPLAYAAEALWRSGLVVVAAAGNKGADATSLDVPAADPYVIAVGALDTNGTLDPSDDGVASFSSRGSSIRQPDFVAPGTGIVSFRVPGSSLDMQFPGARVGDRYFRGSGTSQATAVASGLAALVLQQRPRLSPDQVKVILDASAADLGAPAAAEGNGRVDLSRLAGLITPSADSAKQSFRNAIFDLAQTNNADDSGRNSAGNSRWNGRTWSGRTWSGRTWSGRTWSGRTWSGGEWDDGSAPGS
jgi:serine protease AprX